MPTDIIPSHASRFHGESFLITQQTFLAKLRGGLDYRWHLEDISLAITIIMNLEAIFSDGNMGSHRGEGVDGVFFFVLIRCMEIRAAYQNKNTR